MESELETLFDEVNGWIEDGILEDDYDHLNNVAQALRDTLIDWHAEPSMMLSLPAFMDRVKQNMLTD